MLRLALVFISFIAGEGFLLWLIARNYDRLAARGLLPPGLQKPAIFLIALLLPVAYGLVAITGVGFLAAATDLVPLDIVEIPNVFEGTPIVDLPSQEDDLDLPATGEPNGRIVYVCQIFETRFRDQICIMDANGQNYQRLTQNDNGDYNFPAMGPDGRSVIFAGKEAPEDSFEIYEMPLDGEPRQVSDGEGDASAPDISPNGRQIVYNRFIDGQDTIWLMERNGDQQRMIFGPPNGEGWDPVWSPDGRRILFASDRGGSIQLYTMDPDGQNVEQITEIEGLSGRSDYSPDGQLIATHFGEPWEHEIVLVAPDGSATRQITEGGNNLAPGFSPDGGWITFMSYRDNYRQDLGCEIYIMRRDGSDVQRLTFNDICDWQPRWGPD